VRGAFVPPERHRQSVAGVACAVYLDNRSSEVRTDARLAEGYFVVLDQKAAILLEEERTKADKIMDMLMQDEEVRNLLAKKISQLYSPAPPHPSSPTVP
jgi:streptomycin 6-kinase